MSLSPHQRGNISNIVKQNIESLEQPTQHSGEAFYNVGASSLEQTHSSSGGKLDPSVDLQGSASFKSEKGYQVWGHFQQPGPVKWVHQDPVHTSTWFQGMANPTKVTQKFGVDDTQSRQALHKGNHDMDPLQQEKMSTASSVPYSEPSQSVASGMEWDHHTMAAVHHAQFQALQQGHKPGDSQYQRHAMRHAMPDSTLQSFQLAFGPTKQPPASGFYPAFHGNSASQNLGYSEQTKSQQQLFQLQQQQLQHHQQQIQLQQMHQLQQQQQQQQQQMHLMQQQYQKQKMQEQMQQMQKQQQQQQMQNLPQPFVTPQHQQDQKPTRPQQDERQLKADSSSPPQLRQATAVHPQTQDPIPTSPAEQDFCSGQPSQEPQETQGKHVLPRRSRRLSKDGTSPVSSQPSKEPARNGGVSGPQGPSVGVIQSTQRRRRTSKEINLETLAQKASEMEFLPAKHDESGSSKPGGMGPLVIPVSVPVRRNQGQMDLARSWGHEQRPLHQFQTDRKPSVIVARRRSLRNSTSDSFNQDEEKEDGTDKVKRRPRPEPLVIPPPRPCTFIAPSVYSSITPYQSHLRSPVRTLEHPLVYPPYTPPPILSPVREGSGLYFSAFLSSMAAGSQGMPLPPTPKTANRSLLHSSSSDMTPPVLPLGEATPVSLEPRINIGSHYQAEIPELQNPSLALQDEDKATLVWVPLPADKSTPSQEETVENLMNMACSSVLCGGGTNVELMHHCLHENSGDVVKTLESLLLKNPLFSKNHHLSNYHYAGSDCWTVDEKRYFNKGISAYRKDFFLVQKLVRSKTVAQCVEFYYTYKKQVKVARNGTLLYGPPEVNDWSSETVQKQEQPEAVESKQKGEQEDVRSDHLKTVTQALQVNEIEGKTLVLSIPKIGFADDGAVLKRETQTPPLPVPKPRPEGSAGKRSKPSATSKTQGEPEGIFPCKKCGRVFYKVKSRSAHMKSHAEQEKKAAAQRQREEEERAAARARQEAAISQRMRAEGERELPESSEEEEIMAEPEDERDEDWR